jgi:hypothetical protein
MADKDMGDDLLNRLFSRGMPEPRPEADPEEPGWLREAREMNQRDYPKIDFRGMSLPEMDDAINAYLESMRDSLI